MKIRANSIGTRSRQQRFAGQPVLVSEARRFERAQICFVILLFFHCLGTLFLDRVFAAHYVGKVERQTTTNPLWGNPAWIYEGWVGAKLGTSVAAGDINGDGFSDVVIGAPYWDNQGRVFVFLGSRNGLRKHPSSTLRLSQKEATFGLSVSVAGDVNSDGYADVLVGAPRFDNKGTNEGRVYLYLGSASGLTVPAAWTVSEGENGAQFGNSVAIAGDVNGDGYDDVLVGAPFSQSDTGEAGRVYLYLGNRMGLSRSPAWVVEGGQVDARFGSSIAAAGDVNGDGYGDILIGAYRYDGLKSDEGAVFVYLGSPSGLEGTASWMAAGEKEGSHLGHSLGTAGDVNGDGYSDVIIGASEYGSNDYDTDGRVYVYLGSPVGVGAEPYWEVTWGSQNRFGSSVATAGDVNGDGLSDILVGAKTPAGIEWKEMAFLFLSSDTGISMTPDWIARDAGSVRTTAAVASAGDVNGDGFSDVIVGNSMYRNEYGIAVVYHAIPTPAILQSQPNRHIQGTQSDCWFGASVANCGDVNGDGWSDVAVGAPFATDRAAEAGAAFVFSGSNSTLGGSYEWSVQGSVMWSWFGYSISSAGDVNGDGFDDVIVGAPRYTSDEADEGAAYLYRGSAEGLSVSAAWIGEGNQPGAGYGFSVGRAGDVNGDGYSDVIVGAFRYTHGELEEGRAFVYYGSSSGLSDSLIWKAESNQAGAWFGYAVAGAGDINGDGYSDVIVGAPYYESGETDEGRVFIYVGSPVGLSNEPTWTIEIDREVSRLGIAVASAGDVNGDGYGDIIIGAEGYLVELEDIGSVFVYYGSPSGPGTLHDWAARGDPLTGALGKCVAGAGDVNGDGFSDVVIGDPLFENGQIDEGRVVIFSGSPKGLSAAPTWAAEGDQAEAWFGYSVAAVGDLNGDGLSDIFVGAPRITAGQVCGGRGFTFTTTGVSKDCVTPRQRRADGTAEVGLLGYSGHPDNFRLKVRARPPVGAGKIFVESEVKPHAVPFDGTGIRRSKLRQLSAAEKAARAPFEIDVLVAPPETPGRVHWRVRIGCDLHHTPHTRWMGHPHNITAEADLRMGVPPELMLPPTPPPDQDIPLVLSLMQNYPNPFNPHTTIRFTLPKRGIVRIVVYDVLGRKIRTLLDDVRDEGDHFVSWDGLNDRGEDVATGVYFFRLVSSGGTLTKKMVLTK